MHKNLLTLTILVGCLGLCIMTAAYYNGRSDGIEQTQAFLRQAVRTAANISRNATIQEFIDDVRFQKNNCGGSSGQMIALYTANRPDSESFRVSCAPGNL